MAELANTTVAKNLQDQIGVNPTVGFAPSISQSITPVVNVGTYDQGVLVSPDISGTTLPAVKGKRYVIWGALLSFGKAAAASGDFVQISGTQQGATVPITRAVSIALTQDIRTIEANFTRPIIMDENTSIGSTISGAWTNIRCHVRYQLV